MSKGKISASLIKDGEAAYQKLPALVTDLTTLLSKFDKLPSEVEKSYLTSFKDNLHNSELKKLKATVLDNVSSVLDMLRSFHSWIQALVPKIEDGGNFGVQIQLELVKNLKQYMDDIVKVLEDASTYHEKRGVLLDKMLTKKTREEKITVVSQAIEKDKTGTSKTETDTITSASENEENYQALAMLDVKLYIQLKNSVRLQRDCLVLSADFIDKNQAKIKDPRGSAGASYTY